MTPKIVEQTNKFCPSCVKERSIRDFDDDGERISRICNRCKMERDKVTSLERANAMIDAVACYFCKPSEPLKPGERFITNVVTCQVRLSPQDPPVWVNACELHRLRGYGVREHPSLPYYHTADGRTTYTLNPPEQYNVQMRLSVPAQDALTGEKSPNTAAPGVSADTPTVTNEKGAKQSGIPHRCDLLPPTALLGVAMTLAEGANKYGAENWRGIPIRDHINRAITHLLAYLVGDTSEPHLNHASCRILFAYDLAQLQGGGWSMKADEATEAEKQEAQYKGVLSDNTIEWVNAPRPSDDPFSPKKS